MNRPGTRLRRVAVRLFAARTLERLIDPTIADLQAEYDEAVHGARTWRRRWIWVSGHVAILRVVAVHVASTAMGIVRDVPEQDRWPVRRAAAASAVVMSIGTALLVAPLLRYVSPDNPRAPEMVLYLIPQALPLSIPVGLTFGILWALGRISVSLRSRAIVLSLALAASIVSFSTLAWVVPAANQAFRTSYAGHPVAKGPRELTLGELRDGAGTGRDGHLLAVEYHKRWALGFAPVTLAVFAVALAGRRRWGRLAPVVAGSLTILGYYLTMVSTETAGRHQSLPAFVAAWVPNATLWTLTLALLLCRHGTRRPLLEAP